MRSEAFAGIDRSHCLALASRAMRSVLVDHARSRARKRTEPDWGLPIDELLAAFEQRGGNLIALDAALARLEKMDPVMARAVDLHFFGGLELADTARTLGVLMRTLERRWKATRTWLNAEVERDG